MLLKRLVSFFEISSNPSLFLPMVTMPFLNFIVQLKPYKAFVYVKDNHYGSD